MQTVSGDREPTFLNTMLYPTLIMKPLSELPVLLRDCHDFLRISGKRGNSRANPWGLFGRLQSPTYNFKKIKIVPPLVNPETMVATCGFDVDKVLKTTIFAN